MQDKKGHQLSIAIGEEFKINPPRYLSKIQYELDKLDDLELRFILQYDTADQRIDTLKESLRKKRARLKKLTQQKHTKRKQKALRDKMSLDMGKVKKYQSTKRSIAQKIRTVQRYQALAIAGFKVKRYGRLFHRKYDDKPIQEMMQSRQFAEDIPLHTENREKLLDHAEDLQLTDHAQLPKERGRQTRYVIGLKVDQDAAKPKRDVQERKISELRAEWYREKISILMQKRKAAKGRVNKKKFSDQANKLVLQRRKSITPAACKAYIKRHYQKVTNTDGITYISTAYRKGFDSDDLQDVLNEFMANYRLKENAIDVSAIGLIERRILKRKPKNIKGYKESDWSELG